MKIKLFILGTAAVCIAGLGLAGCKDGMTEYRDVIYIDGADVDPSFKITADDVDLPKSTDITVFASDKIAADTKVILTIDPKKIEVYNRMYATKYAFPPQDTNFSFAALDNDGNPISGTSPYSAEVVIPAGRAASSKARLTVESFDGFDGTTTYCIPVSISYLDRNIEVLESSATKYIIINRPFYSSATSLSGAKWFAPDFYLVDQDGDRTPEEKAKLKAVPALTYEARVKMTGWMNGSPFISTIMGMEENFVLRFGDSMIDPYLLQVARGNNKAQAKTVFELNKWYHIAAVFDGTARTYTLYVNGVKDGEFGPVDHNTIDLTYHQTNNPSKNRFAVGHSENGRYLNGWVSEVRVWTKALTGNDIINNMCIVDPNSDGLLAYWRFSKDDTNATAATDLTGNGWDAKQVTSGTPNFSDTKCPE